MSTISNNANPALTGHLSTAETNKSHKLAVVITQLTDLRRKTEAKETELKTELKEILKPAYFSYNEAAKEAADVNHTFDVSGLQVNFTNAYFIKGDGHKQTLVKLLGADHPLVSTIRETAKVSVDVTQLSPEDANELAKEITNVALKYEIRPQVERHASTTEAFHALRHVYLSMEDNLRLDNELPIVVQIAPIE